MSFSNGSSTNRTFCRSRESGRCVSQGGDRVVVAIDRLSHRRELQAEGVAGLPQQRDAGAFLRAVIDVLSARHGVVDVTRKLVARITRAQLQAICDERQVGADVRIARHVLEQSAHCARSVERSLRAAQYFHAPDVVREQIEHEGGGSLIEAARSHRSFVDVGRNSRARRDRRGRAFRSRRLPRSSVIISPRPTTSWHSSASDSESECQSCLASASKPALTGDGVHPRTGDKANPAGSLGLDPRAALSLLERCNTRNRI